MTFILPETTNLLYGLRETFSDQICSVPCSKGCKKTRDLNALTHITDFDSSISSQYINYRGVVVDDSMLSDSTYAVVIIDDSEAVYQHPITIEDFKKLKAKKQKCALFLYLIDEKDLRPNSFYIQDNNGVEIGSWLDSNLEDSSSLSESFNVFQYHSLQNGPKDLPAKLSIAHQLNIFISELCAYKQHEFGEQFGTFLCGLESHVLKNVQDFQWHIDFSIIEPSTKQLRFTKSPSFRLSSLPNLTHELPPLTIELQNQNTVNYAEVFHDYKRKHIIPSEVDLGYLKFDKEEIAFLVFFLILARVYHEENKDFLSIWSEFIEGKATFEQVLSSKVEYLRIQEFENLDTLHGILRKHKTTLNESYLKLLLSRLPQTERSKFEPVCLRDLIFGTWLADIAQLDHTIDWISNHWIEVFSRLPVYQTLDFKNVNEDSNLDDKIRIIFQGISITSASELSKTCIVPLDYLILNWFSYKEGKVPQKYYIIPVWESRVGGENIGVIYSHVISYADYNDLSEVQHISSTIGQVMADAYYSKQIKLNDRWHTMGSLAHEMKNYSDLISTRLAAGIMEISSEAYKMKKHEDMVSTRLKAGTEQIEKSLEKVSYAQKRLKIVNAITVGLFNAVNTITGNQTAKAQKKVVEKLSSSLAKPTIEACLKYLLISHKYDLINGIGKSEQAILRWDTEKDESKESLFLNMINLIYLNDRLQKNELNEEDEKLFSINIDFTDEESLNTLQMVKAYHHLYYESNEPLDADDVFEDILNETLQAIYQSDHESSDLSQAGQFGEIDLKLIELIMRSNVYMWIYAFLRETVENIRADAHKSANPHILDSNTKLILEELKKIDQNQYFDKNVLHEVVLSNGTKVPFIDIEYNIEVQDSIAKVSITQINRQAGKKDFLKAKDSGKDTKQENESLLQLSRGQLLANELYGAEGMGMGEHLTSKIIDYYDEEMDITIIKRISYLQFWLDR